MATGQEARRRRDAAMLAALQLVLLVGFAVLVRFEARVNPELLARRYPGVKEMLMKDYVEDESSCGVAPLAVFQDVHVMIFVGFGFLMTFLRRYGYSAVGFNLLVGAVTVQWALLVRGLFHLDPRDSKIHLSLTSILEADLATAAVLISMGAVLGKTTALQLVLMSLIEIVIGTANEHLGLTVFKAVDCGASMFVHVFGAYFGLAASLVLGHGARIRKGEGNALEGSSYSSDRFAMIATLFLWLFWPSFNAALAEGDAQQRAMLNTYLALASCCAVAFALSAVLAPEAKFDMVHVQNATLAGGVAVGTAADVLLQPWGALALGALSGALSVAGYARLQPLLLRYGRLHDTCGVHNLHGLPGVLAGLAGAVVAALATPEAYGGAEALASAFPALAAHNATGGAVADARSAGAQAAFQLLALVVTLAVALAGGALTGFILKVPFFNNVTREHWFSDDYHWEVPAESVHSHSENGKTKENFEEAKTDTSLCDSQLHM